MHTTSPFVLNPGESRSVPLLIYGTGFSVKLAGAGTAGGYTAMECLIAPQTGPPLHRHSREDEAFYVIEGEYDFEIDGNQFTVGPGAFVFAPRGTAHTFQNIASTPGRMLVTLQPAGLEDCFAELAAATAGMREPDLSLIIPLARKYGLELLGPPLAARHLEIEPE